MYILQLLKLDGNYTRMLRAILNMSWRQHSTKHQYTATYLPSRKISKLDEPDTQDTAGEARTSSEVMYFYGPPPMAEQSQDGQLEHTYSSSVKIRDVSQKTCQKRWTIGRNGERGSWISVLATRHDDDDITMRLVDFYHLSNILKHLVTWRCPSPFQWLWLLLSFYGPGRYLFRLN